MNEDKINEAISLIEETMADESKVEFMGVKGVAMQAIEDIKKPIADFKLVWKAYLAQGEEEGKNKSAEYLKNKRADLVESREARMEEVARYDRRITKIDADIKKLTGETKERLAEVIPFPERTAEAGVPAQGEGAVATDILKPESHYEEIVGKY